MTKRVDRMRVGERNICLDCLAVLVCCEGQYYSQFICQSEARPMSCVIDGHLLVLIATSPYTGTFIFKEAPFRGVSSRYLDNYLGWRWALDRQWIATPEALLRSALGIFHP